MPPGTGEPCCLLCALSRAAEDVGLTIWVTPRFLHPWCPAARHSSRVRPESRLHFCVQTPRGASRRRELVASWCGRPLDGDVLLLSRNLWRDATQPSQQPAGRGADRFLTSAMGFLTVATGRQELAQRVSSCGGSGSLAFPAPDTTAPQKREKQ